MVAMKTSLPINGEIALIDLYYPIITTGIYLGILSRFPTDEELKVVQAYFQSSELTRREAGVDLVWALINSQEFLYRH